MPSLINLTTYHLAILQILSQEKKPISSSELHERVSHNTKLSGFISRLTIPKVIYDLHCNRIPICKNSRGYFYAREQKDLDKFIKAFEKKIHKDQKELSYLKDSSKFVGYFENDFVIEVDLPVRTKENTVSIQRFPCDVFGKPKIPEGVEIIT